MKLITCIRILIKIVSIIQLVQLGKTRPTSELEHATKLFNGDQPFKRQSMKPGEQLSPEMITNPGPEFYQGEIMDEDEQEESAVKPKEESVEEPKDESVVEPKDEPVEEPKEESVVEPKDEPVEEPKEESVVEPKEESDNHPVPKLAEHTDPSNPSDPLHLVNHLN